MRRSYGSGSGWLSTAMLAILGGAGVALLAGIVLVFSVVITGFFGWLTGHIAVFFFGNWIENGLNWLVGSERFTQDMIPFIFATLAMVGSFFKTTVNNKSGD